MGLGGKDPTGEENKNEHGFMSLSWHLKSFSSLLYIVKACKEVSGAICSQVDASECSRARRLCLED